MNHNTENKPRIFGLDVIRASAILMVVFSHVYYLLDSTNPLFISLSGLFGFAGVELFFVLSGYLIGGILLKMYVSESYNGKTILHFLKRRWMRTLPNYYVVLLVNVVLGLLIGYDMSNAWQYFIFVQNLFHFNITFFSESWSLSIEEWTYLITPLFFFITYRFMKNKKTGFIVTTLFLIFIFHVFRFWFNEQNIVENMVQWNEEVKSLVIYRIDAILVGFLVAWVFNYYENILKKLGVYFFIIGIHLFFMQYVVMNIIGFTIVDTPQYFNVFYFTLSSITFAFILPVFVFWKQANGILVQIINWISKLSYSIYLVHYSLVTVLVKYLNSNYLTSISSFVLIVIYLLSVVFLSFLLYTFVEKPFMDKRLNLSN